MDRILINKIESTEGNWWECYCDQYSKSSCHGVGSSPEESLINFLYELKIFEEIINKEEEEKKPKFTKDDLKYGDMVIFRNGDDGWVGESEYRSGLGIYNSRGELPNVFYNDDLKYTSFKDNDIIRIQRRNENGNYVVIWEGE